MTDELSKNMRDTALKHIAAYNTPNAWDADAIWALKAPGAEHYLHPKDSLDPQFQGNIDGEKHRHFMAFFGPLFTHFEQKIVWEVIDPKQRMLVHGLDCTMGFKAFADEPAEDNYKAEYVWILWFNESGTKITKMEEFMDLQRLLGYVSPKAGRYAQWLSSQEKS